MRSPLNLQENRSLKELTTFGIGGPARYFIEAHSIHEMSQLLIFCKQEQLPYFILGRGSNCLFDDRGFDGLVIANRIDFIERPSEDTFYVGAGYSFSLLGSQTARQKWSGLEFASGIPGSVGGAVYMNAGANGKETCEHLISIDFITEDGQLRKLDRSEIEFGYRYSSFQDQAGAIVAATFRLIPSSAARDKQLDIINYRKKTQPYGAKSAGCVFKNPSRELSAGALIDQSGLKGRTLGGAQISPLHANFVVNVDSATANEVLALIELIKKDVKAKTGIELENEVRCIPYQLSSK